MRATRCNYLLDFNPKFDKLRTEWDRERQAAMAGADSLKALYAADDFKSKMFQHTFIPTFSTKNSAL